MEDWFRFQVWFLRQVYAPDVDSLFTLGPEYTGGKFAISNVRDKHNRTAFDNTHLLRLGNQWRFTFQDLE